MSFRSRIAKLAKNQDIEGIVECIPKSQLIANKDLVIPLFSQSIEEYLLNQLREMLDIPIIVQQQEEKEEKVSVTGYSFDINEIIERMEDLIDDEGESEFLLKDGMSMNHIRMYQFFRSTPTVRRDILVAINMFNNDQIQSNYFLEIVNFLAYGPSNPIVGDHYIHDDKMYRMRASYPQDHKTTNVECESCSDIIGNILESYRAPLERGGWYGCFCSIECMKYEADDSLDYNKFLFKLMSRQMKLLDQGEA